MQYACPQCHAALPAAGVDCPYCVGALELPGERRVVTILFSDLVDFTENANKFDAEELGQVMAELEHHVKQIVEHHGGLLNQVVGDEFMCLFGFPLAHDDDPARCAHAARELHDMAQALAESWAERGVPIPLQLHSGCATGEVVVVRSTVDQVGGVFGVKGPAVILAARARGAAGAGMLLCCAHTHAQIREYFACSPPQPTDLKGFDARVTLHVVGQPSAAQRRFDVAVRRGLTRWIGREDQLCTLGELLECSAAGRGHCVVIRGEAGVGKTRLAYQFGGQIAPERHTAVAGYCHRSGDTRVYGPLIDALNEALELDPQAKQFDQQDTVVRRLTALDPDVEQFLPHLLMLLNIPSQRYRVNEHLPDEVLKAQFQTALTLTLRSIARQHPLVVTLDDWQWADEASREWLDNFLPTVHESALLLVVLTRPEREPDWHASGNATLMRLDTLSLEQTRALFGYVVGATELPDGLDVVVHEYAGGNALFVEEIARQLLESRQVVMDNGRAILRTALTELQRPALVESVIQARIALLPRAVRETLKLGAVIGRVFEVDVLSHTSTSPTSVPAALEELLARDFIHQVTAVPPLRYRFKHAVVQKATYETLLRQQRVGLHARVAAALEALRADRLVDFHEDLAYHYRHAKVVEKAALYLGYAAARSSQLYQIPQAMAQYLDAIELMETVPLNDNLQRLRIEYALALGRRAFIKPMPKVYTTLLKSYEIAQEVGDQWLLAQTALTLGNVSWLESRFAPARQHLRDAMQLAETNRFATLSAAAEGSFGHTMFYSADFPTGIRHLERAAQALLGGRNRVLMHNVRNYLALQYGFTGRFADACALQDAIVADAADTGHRFIEQATRLWCNLGKALQGDWHGAEALCNAALQIGDTTDARYMSAYAHCSRGQARYFTGDDRTSARHEFADGLTNLHGLGHQLAISMYEAWYAEICALSGDVEQARSHAQCALDCSARQEYVGEIVALRALAIAEAAHPQADWGLVDRHLARALELAPQRWQFPDEAITHFRQAEILAWRGASDAAQSALTKAEQAFSALAMSDWWRAGARLLSERLKRGYRGTTFMPYCGAEPNKDNARDALEAQRG